MLEVNVVGTFHMTKAAAEYMKDHGGAIVLASSGSIKVRRLGGGSGSV